ncbi:MAG: hypothetical protein ACK56I_01050, partial [bacterium]
MTALGRTPGIRAMVRVARKAGRLASTGRGRSRDTRRSRRPRGVETEDDRTGAAHGPRRSGHPDAEPPREAQC